MAFCLSISSVSAPVVLLELGRLSLSCYCLLSDHKQSSSSVTRNALFLFQRHEDLRVNLLVCQGAMGTMLLQCRVKLASQWRSTGCCFLSFSNVIIVLSAGIVLGSVCQIAAALLLGPTFYSAPFSLCHHLVLLMLASLAQWLVFTILLPASPLSKDEIKPCKEWLQHRRLFTDRKNAQPPTEGERRSFGRF